MAETRAGGEQRRGEPSLSDIAAARNAMQATAERYYRRGRDGQQGDSLWAVAPAADSHCYRCAALCCLLIEIDRSAAEAPLPER